MPSKPHTETKTIASLERLYNSVNGNPRWHVYFTDGTDAITLSDAGIGYELNNPAFRDAPVVFTFTRDGRIYHATPAPKGDEG